MFWLSKATSRAGVLVVSGAVAALVAGCGPEAPKVEYADVTGKVTLKGEPLKLGTVTFQPASGAPASGDIQSDGTYKLKGVVGKNKVMIVAREGEDVAPPSADPAERKAAMAAAAAKGPPKNLVPPEYGTPASTLSFEVKPGANTADFNIP